MNYYFLFIIIIVFILILYFSLFKSSKKSNIIPGESVKSENSNSKESFEKIPDIKKSNNKNIEILVLVTKSCPACKYYDAHTHDKILEFCKNNNYKYKRVYQDDDKDHLFDKYKVEYIPCCFVIINGKSNKLNGSITCENISNLIKNIDIN